MEEILIDADQFIPQVVIADLPTTPPEGKGDDHDVAIDAAGAHIHASILGAMQKAGRDTGDNEQHMAISMVVDALAHLDLKTNESWCALDYSDRVKYAALFLRLKAIERHLQLQLIMEHARRLSSQGVSLN